MTARHQAREAALQILYFWEMGQAQPISAIDAYFAEHWPDAPDDVRAFAARLVLGTIAEIAQLDDLIGAHSKHWRVNRLAVIDRLVLRMAAWELQHEADTPPAVVMDEALELVRRFSGEEAVRFVNGVVDAIHRSLADGDSGAGVPPTQ